MMIPSLLQANRRQTAGPTRNFIYADGQDGRRLVNRCYVREAAEGRAADVCFVTWFGWTVEGPPMHVHGGCSATILDAVMGACCWANQQLCMTANLQVDYKRPLPLGTVAVAHAQLERREGRKLFLKASLCSLDRVTTFSEGTSIYVTPRTTSLPPSVAS